MLAQRSIDIFAILLVLGRPTAHLDEVPIGAVLAFILLAANAWPSTAVISKAPRQLDPAGGRPHLTSGRGQWRVGMK